MNIFFPLIFLPILQFSFVSCGSSIISTATLPIISRPKRGNWYALRTLDEVLPSFNNLEFDFVRQYIAGSNGTNKVLLFLSVETDYNTGNRTNLFRRIEEIFASARTNSYFIIFRTFYKQGEPANFSIIEADIKQWVVFLSQHIDVLYCVQAGWLGAGFGEWWGTPTTPFNDNGENPIIAYKKTFIVQELLKIPGIPISIRSPRDIANYFHAISRIGFHNDCILSGGPEGTDTGTFDAPSVFWKANEIAKARAYTVNQIRSLRGGESCPGPYSNSLMTCQDLLDYVVTYRLSYLNLAFPERVLEIYKQNSDCVQKITAALALNG